jgi:hypothetical protein
MNRVPFHWWIGLPGLLLAFAALVKVDPAAAQVLYGSIVGTVADQSDAVVPKATITITNKNTGLGSRPPEKVL